jgi:hypothetical protein
MDRSKILEIANNYITIDRQATHGQAEDNFKDISRLWSGYLDIEIHPKDVAMMMVLLKVIRFKKNPGHIDNAIDLCGYGALAGEMGGAWKVAQNRENNE